MSTVRFANNHALEDRLAGGLDVLVSVQAIVSGMVPGALDEAQPTAAQVLTYGFALMKEITELMDEMGWKPWKARGAADKERIADELADILAFLGLLLIYILKLTGLTRHDLAAAYLKKSDVNVARFNGQVAGYDKLEKE